MDAFNAWLDRMNEPLAVTLTTSDLQALTNALALALDAIGIVNEDDMDPIRVANVARYERDDTGLVETEEQHMEELRRRLRDIYDLNMKTRRRAYREAMGGD